MEATAELDTVRRAVRSVLEASAEFRALEPEVRRRLAEGLVRVAHAATALSDEEAGASRETARAPARAQSAGDEFSGVAADRVAATTQSILTAVSFPRFVTDLINGVFKAIMDTSIQQLNAYVELMNNVAASTEGFADSNMGSDRARTWLADRYPGSFMLDDEGDEDDDPPEPGTAPERRLVMRPGASAPSPEALGTDLGLAATETVPTGDPERTLVPLARRALAKTRQEMLATMVMMGMQRIIIESGRINASMRFHIDTRSAAQQDAGSTFDFRNTISASGSFGAGPWGVSASMQNTIGYVSTERTQTTEEMNTELDLNSSVEVVFKSDYLPLNRMASGDQISRIRDNSRNPEAEAELAAIAARTERAKAAAQTDQQRRASLDQRLVAPAAPPPPAAAAAPRAATPPAAAPPAATPPAATPPAATPPAAAPPAAATPPAATPPAATPPAGGAATPAATVSPPARLR